MHYNGVTKLSPRFTFSAFVARIKRRLPSNLITSLSKLALIEQPCTALGWEEVEKSLEATVTSSLDSSSSEAKSKILAYVCDGCGSSYKTGTAANRNNFFKHAEVSCKQKRLRLHQNRCDSCNAAYSHLQHLTEHMRGHKIKMASRVKANRATKAKKHPEMPAVKAKKRMDGSDGRKAKPKRRSRKIAPA